MITVWQIWAIIALLFIILEVFTSGFAVCCFSFGAAAAAIAAALDGSFGVQVLLFALFTALSFVTVRPLVLKFFFKDKDVVRTNADALAGREARVTEAIDPASGTGRVKVDGDDWKAVSEDGSAIPVGTAVEIVRLDSVIVTVKLK